MAKYTEAYNDITNRNIDIMFPVVSPPLFQIFIRI